MNDTKTMAALQKSGGFPLEVQEEIGVTAANVERFDTYVRKARADTQREFLHVCRRLDEMHLLKSSSNKTADPSESSSKNSSATLRLLEGYGGAITNIRRRPNDIQQTRHT